MPKSPRISVSQLVRAGSFDDIVGLPRVLRAASSGLVDQRECALPNPLAHLSTRIDSFFSRETADNNCSID